MPFEIELATKHETDKWSLEQTKEALELQDLLDKDDRKGYGERLIELSKESNGAHEFTRIDGKIYEFLNKNEKIEVFIKFQVKKSVITWSFLAPKDVTFQSFRDRVFNTAAMAHSCVDNSCETYYRGTDHLHIREMHSCEEEARYNHNHYRTADGGPVTPIEVYQHLVAFCAQQEGRQFITSIEERDDIILKYALYWAEFNADINYVALFLMDKEQGFKQINQRLLDIARIGTLTPDQADEKLDKFFSSTHGRNILHLASKKGLPLDKLSDVKNYLKSTYRQIYLKVSSPIQKAIASDPSLESVKSDVTIVGGSKSPSRQSPRDEYLSSSDQQLDDIDKLEFQTFASDVIKHCRNIDKKLLQDLELEDFRKGLLLYYALRTAQINSKFELTLGEQRFHSDLTTDAKIKQMLKELPSLQVGSTESSIGGVLLSKLINWVKKSTPELDKWVAWVKVNGSQSFGSRISGVRLVDGTVNLSVLPPKPTSNTNGGFIDIDFGEAALKTVFLPKSTTVQLPSKTSERHESLKVELGHELKSLVDQQLTVNKLERSVFQAKVQVIEAALSVLAGKSSKKDLEAAMTKNKGWNSVSSTGFKSRLEVKIQEVIDLYTPEASLGTKLS
ncbi:hypothetical protein [Legionella waltersii]|uniref:Uncharacterized protein n=1 Tax=Legionella waltersii TaxID=66969 RepID=A0A0W1A2J7_9GAMM|nr:hypothetical protein [Legionella waltersii]KTD75567.1 hypothetical protein Lwal_2505 [Legionella waltersii]SNU98770.1 Uncharacterised protein [Legionella waltersii]